MFSKAMLSLLLSLMVCVVLVATAVAEVPRLINYQGRLTDDLGNPLDGSYWMTFSIYDAENDGTMKWSSNPRSTIDVDNGLFTYQLGSNYPLPNDIFTDSSNWLEIVVESDRIVPRTQLISVPFAYHAKAADSDNDWTEVHEGIHRVEGNVGIGMEDPRAKLDVAGVIRILRDDDFSYPGDGEGMELFYDPINRVGVIQVFDRPMGTRRMNLRGGNVGIDVIDPQYKLDVAGECHASSFPTSSDARLKTNVKQLENVLDKIEQIRGVSFDWNETYDSLGRSTGHREIGMIAQEVEAVFPELVTTWSDENYRAVDYSRMTGVLIEAIKELRAENEKLQKRIQALEKR